MDIDAGALPAAEEWTERERLANEKDVLGFYVSGHPLAGHARLLSMLATATADRIPDLDDGTRVIVGGMVTGVRTAVTQRGDRMAFITVEDLTGTFEVVVFSEAYEASRDYLEPDRPVIIEGRANRTDTRSGIRATSITPIELAQSKLVHSVHVRVPNGDAGNGIAERLAQTASNYTGPLPLYIHYGVHGLDAVIRASDQFRLGPTDQCLDTLTGLLGKGNVWFSAQD